MSPIVNCVAYCDGQRVESVEIERIGEVLQQPPIMTRSVSQVRRTTTLGYAYA